MSTNNIYANIRLFLNPKLPEIILDRSNIFYIIELMFIYSFSEKSSSLIFTP
jgi:hypothetical protein